MSRRLGLFGGSFDPIHEGHLHAARAATDAFRLDRVVFVPAWRSPFKADRRPAPAADRLAMVELAIRGAADWTVSDLELRRGGSSYTIDTVRSVRAAVGEPPDTELFLIVGSDNLPGLPDWRSVEELLELVQPIVVFRAGDGAEHLPALDARLPAPLARKVRAGFLELPPVDVSSTEVRAGGLVPGVRVPPAVVEYAREHGLYASEARGD